MKRALARREVRNGDNEENLRQLARHVAEEAAFEAFLEQRLEKRCAFIATLYRCFLVFFFFAVSLEMFASPLSTKKHFTDSERLGRRDFGLA